MKRKKQVNIHETKTHLSRLLREVAQGMEIIIAKGDLPIARIVRFDPCHQKRVFGLSKGAVKMNADFDEPLEEFKKYQINDL